MSIKARYPATFPVLNLDFANSKRLDPRITFTRASSASYFDRDGYLKLASSGAPRFDYDPVTLQPKGLLIEEQRTNLLTYSEQFDNAAWGKNVATVTANVTTAPDGTVTADKLTSNAASNGYLDQTASYVAGTTYVWSFFAKAAERTQISFLLYGTNFGGGSNVGRTYSLTGAGSISALGGTIAPTDATIALVGAGWYRCTFTYSCTVSNTGKFFQLRDNLGGDGTSGLYIWGAQLEAGSFPTSYIPTTSAQATRAADVATMTGTNFSSWYNQTEGTLFAEGESFGGAVSGLYEVSASGNSLQSVSVRLGQKFSFAQGLNRALLSYSQGAFIRHAFAFKPNDYSASAAGGILTIINGQPTDVPSGANLLTIGGLNTSQFSLNGHIKRIAYFPKRLSNTELQAITS